MADIKVPEFIPITDELEHAILRYLEAMAGCGDANFWTSPMEILRVRVGVAVLNAMGLYREPSRRDGLAASTVELVGKSERRTLPFIVRAKVMARDDFKCLECDSHQNLTIDHIIPVSRGGTDDESNLRTLCMFCNSRKGAKLL